MDDFAKVSLEGVTRAYGGQVALDGVDLTLSRGRILGLLGASGSGKSTLLRLISGLEPVDAGEIRIDGVRVSSPGRTLAPEARRVGMVFQDFALFPHLNVARNVGFGLKGQPALRRDATVGALLERVRLANRADAFPHMLSGGEQQRVALARAMARDPAVILLDEPFSSLDGPLRTDLRDELIGTLRDTGVSAVIVTHDAEDAMVMADDLALIEAGRVLQVGTPRDCYFRPNSVSAARLLGPVNLLPARVSKGVASSYLGSVATDLADGSALIGVRPNDLSLAAVAGSVAGTVDKVTFAGAFHAVQVATAAGVLTLHLSRPALGAGGAVSVTADPDRLMVLKHPHRPS